MVDTKILTDIKIDQCPVWGAHTDYLLNEETSVKQKGGTCLSERFVNLLKQCRSYDVVVTADIRTAQVFGLIRTLLRWKRPKHIILELMLDEPRSDIAWKLKHFVQRLCFASVEVIFVSARSEIQTYAERLGLQRDCFRFLPFHTNVVNPMMVEGSGRYILSAGKTGRDFATLAAAVEGLKTKVVVVSDRLNIDGIIFPPNVELHVDIPYERYLELLYDCSLVVVPLKKLLKSTGQVVFLEAMALGKPIIATAATGTEDYIKHGVTGTLVAPEDIESLRAAIAGFIEHPASYVTMAIRAFEQIMSRHTFNIYTQTILEAAHEVCMRSYTPQSGDHHAITS